jgi:hypothetical protein
LFHNSVTPLHLKIEIKMKKQSAIRWLALEGNGTGGDAPAVVMAAPGLLLTFIQLHNLINQTYQDPAAKRTERNWDKIVSDVISAEPEEKPSGDAALNEFFKDLYARSIIIYNVHCSNNIMMGQWQAMRTPSAP